MKRQHNYEYESRITPILPSGTNSTMFTECCGCAICDRELSCPVCGAHVIGWDCKSDGERSNVRWRNATRNWRRA